MGEGFDYSGYEQEEIEMWEEIYEDANYWAKITEEEIIVEVNNLKSHIETFYKRLNDMVYDNDHDGVAKLQKDLYMHDLSEEGWVYVFHERNKGSFPAASHDMNRPEWVNKYKSPEELKQYDMVMNYYKDNQWIRSTCDLIYSMLGQMNLESAFKLLTITEEFVGENYDKDLYNRVNGEIRDIYQRCITDMKHWEFVAADVHRRNYSSDDEYRRARRKGYIEEVKKWPFYTNSFEVNSSGQFSVKSSVIAKMKVIDDYTLEVTLCHGGIMGDMKDTLERCKTITDFIKKYEDQLKTDAYRSLVAAFRSMCNSVRSFAQESITEYESYDEPWDQDPYCFMKQLPVLEEMSNTEWMDPDKSEPYEEGTHYEELYRKAADALTLHCKRFSELKGTNP
ncbi:MAG: hypothetical protein IKT01_06015 [Eubacteriaceae bacterium]|nr:hypothetical protein [Eubacteriaceae bacterium]